MENLSGEGKAIFDTIAAAVDAQHRKDKQELEALIVQSVSAAVTRTVDTAVHSSVNKVVTKAVFDMQVYTDGIESSLQRGLDEIYIHVGLAAHSDELDPLIGKLASATETGLDGRRLDSTTWRPGVGANGPYIPPPARGVVNEKLYEIDLLEDQYLDNKGLVRRVTTKP